MENLNFRFFFCNLLIIFWSNIGIVQGIVGGKEVGIDEFKFMVSVQANDQHVCGGCIIANDFVVTAAQCVIGPDNQFKNQKFTVLAGVDNLIRQEPFKIIRSVEIIFVPNDYDPLKTESYATGDLALLKIKQGFYNYTNSVLGIASLPTRISVTHYQLYSYKKPIMIGYGIDTVNRGVKRDRDNLEIFQNTFEKLRSIQTEVLHKNACKSIFSYPLGDKHIAAQAKDLENLVGVCKGDIGGPLILDDTIIGVLSRYTDTCDEMHHAGLYTRITSYVPFIKKVQTNKQLNKVARMAAYKRRNIQGKISEVEEDLIEVTTIV